MNKNIAAIIFLVAMTATIVAADLLFFRHRFWQRLAANIGIALVFIAFYFRIFK